MFLAIVLVCLASMPEDCSPDVVHQFTYGERYATRTACEETLEQHEKAVAALVHDQFPDLSILLLSRCAPEGNPA